jgi:hypothetical protein
MLNAQRDASHYGQSVVASFYLDFLIIEDATPLFNLIDGY